MNLYHVLTCIIMLSDIVVIPFINVDVRTIDERSLHFRIYYFC
jgi:hypothetical protein